MNGTLNNIVSAKMFGFILGENEQEYFFHRSDVPDIWDEMVMEFERLGRKVKVTFEPTKTPKGPRAANIVLYGSEY